MFTSLFPWLPWRKQLSSKVVATDGRSLAEHSVVSSSRCDILDEILKVPPLFDAFEDYCRKALCSEVRDLH